ncbi:hypothetical protein [Bacillus thuringiensis]|nr:hypothetical protein [Bacillus thuringiensis]
MDKQCKTVIVGNNLDGVSCANCGGPTWIKTLDSTEKQVKKDKIQGLTIELNVDTTEALKQMKEVTQAANECVDALEKLEKAMGRFTGKNGLIESGVINVELDGGTIANQTYKAIQDFRAEQL